MKLYGFTPSVYSWIARLTLAEKGAIAQWVEVDPFADEVPSTYFELNPFGRVPVLADGDFVLYETNAITRYIDEAKSGPRLQPSSATDRARMTQIVSIIDNYAYWPLVRQFFSHGYYRPRLGLPHDPEQRRLGLLAAPRVLSALELLASGSPFLVSDQLTLADLHLAPVLGYFSMDADGAALLKHYPRLSAWWQRMAHRPHFVSSRPTLV